MAARFPTPAPLLEPRPKTATMTGVLRKTKEKRQETEDKRQETERKKTGIIRCGKGTRRRYNYI